MSKSNSTKSERRDIPGFPGYQVTRDGEVWSCRTPRGNINPQKWRKMKPQISEYTCGYPQVTLSFKGRLKVKLVGWLVLEAFVGPRPPGYVCCHFPDKSPLNNNLENLRWDTEKANHADMIFHGTDHRGTKHYAARLTEADVLSIRARNPKTMAECRALGVEYGVKYKTIWAIAKRKIWKHI